MQRYKIRFGIPGPTADWPTVQGMLEASERHDVLMPRDVGHNTVGNFDDQWCEANNAFEAGEAELFVQLHSDVYPVDAGWLDVMVEVMERRRVSLVSATVAMKDNRALVSCGTADPKNPCLGRMLKIEDLEDLPEDFDQVDLGCPERILLHNTGCWLADLRDDRWRTTDADGNMLACFNFPRWNRRSKNGLWIAEGNSEDWYFSRMAHAIGIPSVITRRVRLNHRGSILFPNTPNKAWGRRRCHEPAQSEELTNA